MVVAIIQARMGSTRLPNKVMKEILGKPIISYLLENVKKSTLINKVILATTTDKKDDHLANYVKELGFTVYRGSEDDVLSRYYEAFQTLDDVNKVKGIVRLTGDCPLLQPTLIDKVIDTFINSDYDHVCLSPQYMEGLDTEIFKPQLLIDAYNNAKKASQREHVMLYISDNKEKYNMFQLLNSSDDSKYRITVDEEKDFEVVKAIIEEFEKLNKEKDVENIKKFLDQNHIFFKFNYYKK